MDTTALTMVSVCIMVLSSSVQEFHKKVLTFNFKTRYYKIKPQTTLQFWQRR